MQVFDYVLRVDDAPLSYVEARQPYDCTDALVTDGYEANWQPYQDWRTEQAHQLGPDPMARQPAPRLADAPDERVVSFTYRYDWREVGVARGGESLGAGRGRGPARPEPAARRARRPPQRGART